MMCMKAARSLVRLELPKAVAADVLRKWFACCLITGLYAMTVILIPVVGDAALAFCFGSALALAWSCAAPSAVIDIGRALDAARSLVRLELPETIGAMLLRRSLMYWEVLKWAVAFVRYRSARVLLMMLACPLMPLLMVSLYSAALLQIPIALVLFLMDRWLPKPSFDHYIKKKVSNKRELRKASSTMRRAQRKVRHLFPRTAHTYFKTCFL